MLGRLIESNKGKANLVCPHNFVYTRHGTCGSTTYWKCLEFRRKHCSAFAKTGPENLEILNQPVHNHGSNIASLEFKMDMQSKKIAVQNIALPPRVIFEEIASNLERKQAIVPKTEAAFCLYSYTTK